MGGKCVSGSLQMNADYRVTGILLGDEEVIESREPKPRETVIQECAKCCTDAEAEVNSDGDSVHCLGVWGGRWGWKKRLHITNLL